MTKNPCAIHAPIYKKRSVMQFSTASIDDIPTLCQLLCESTAPESEAAPLPEAYAASLRALIDGHNKTSILVAREADKVIGMVTLTRSSAPDVQVALIEDMVVASHVRQQRVGSQLLEYACRFAKEHGVKRIILFTDVDNLVAQRFYIKHGFTSSSTLTPRTIISFSADI